MCAKKKFNKREKKNDQWDSRLNDNFNNNKKKNNLLNSSAYWAMTYIF